MAQRGQRDESLAVEGIAADDLARRELLWLRAKEKEDEVLARDLERADPGLVSRLSEAGCDLEGCADEEPRDRRERFGRLWDDRYEWHARSARRS